MAGKMDEKAHKAEEGELSHCVSNLIHAFSNGLKVFKKLRERKRKRRVRKDSHPNDAAVSEEVQLSKSLKRGPQELAERYDACYSQTGQRFAKGDAIAHASLAETLIKLNTGLVAIIASFLSHDQKGGKTHLNLDYKSLTNLSDASRREALQSMTQLYQRLSQSQLQIQHFNNVSCTRCGSQKHTDCSPRSSTASSSSKDKKKKKKKHTSTRQRVTGPSITRMPIKSSSQPQLVVVRPRPARKGSSNSPWPGKSQSPLSSTYSSPLASPLPLYIAEEPFEVETNGMIKGVLGYPASCSYPYVMQEDLHLPAPKLPTCTPTPRNPLSPAHKTWMPWPQGEKGPSQALVTMPLRRRADKLTPSSYTFASDSTKLGEIPQRNWTTPWDYEEAERLNEAAAMGSYGVAPVMVDEKVGRKKGIFKWMRKGNGAGVAA